MSELRAIPGNNVDPGSYSKQMVDDRQLLTNRDYVLMTAAHNEEAFIEKTIKSVLAQTLLPKRWVIVSDGSTDRTDEIIESYAREQQLICFLKLTRPAGRQFASKGIALQKGVKLLEGVSFGFIGNIDADIAVEPAYFATLLEHFERDPQLGLAAGFIYEESDGVFRSRAANRTDSIPHAAQMVRRECYEMIGGYSIFKYGGEDWYAQQCAKMNGWHAEAIPELQILHGRHTGTAGNLLKHQFRLGRLDYSFGSDPVFEFLKCAVRISERPRLLGALTRFLGFAWSSACRESRPVSNEFVQFLRKEQRSKVLNMFRGKSRDNVLRLENR